MASDSSFYRFKNAKIVIALELMKRGWKLYGYNAGKMDTYTDYYESPYWSGIATLNGYTLAIDAYDNHLSGTKIEKYVSDEEIVLSEKISKTIDKLKEIRTERGASEAEEKTAKEKIEKLIAKYNDGKKSHYVVTDVYPTYQKNPGRSSWHVEKDGVIIDKGTGIGKFYSLRYFNLKESEEDIEKYNPGDYYYDEAKEKIDTYKKFIKWLERIDSAAGKRIGRNKKSYVMETVNVVEYKTKNCVVPCDGEIKDGQLFEIVSPFFSYGVREGYVYRIHKSSAGFYTSVRLSKNLTKELNPFAATWNNFYINEKNFNKWIEHGEIRFVRLSVKSEKIIVQKVVKKPIKTA